MHFGLLPLKANVRRSRYPSSYPFFTKWNVTICFSADQRPNHTCDNGTVRSLCYKRFGIELCFAYLRYIADHNSENGTDIPARTMDANNVSGSQRQLPSVFWSLISLSAGILRFLPSSGWHSISKTYNVKISICCVTVLGLLAKHLRNIQLCFQDKGNLREYSSIKFIREISSRSRSWHWYLWVVLFRKERKPEISDLELDAAHLWIILCLELLVYLARHDKFGNSRNK